MMKTLRARARARGVVALVGLAVAFWIAGCGNDESGVEPDTTMPEITSGPSVSELTTGAALIVWTTDESANSVVRYGPDTLLVLTATDPSLKVDHSVWIRSGLVPDTTVYYRVESTDPSLNTVRSEIDSLVPPRATLEFSPDTTTVAMGESFAVDLTATAVTDLFGAAFTVLFPPALVSCDSASAGSFLEGDSDTVLTLVQIDNLEGTASVGLTRLRGVDGVDGSGVLATFHFTPLAMGEGPIRVNTDDLALEDPHGADMANFELMERPDGRLVVTAP